MNRLSLFKVWNHVFTAGVFLVAFLFYLPMGREGSPKYLSGMVATILLASQLWVVFVNHVFLPGMAKGRVFVKSAWLQLLNAYLATTLLIWYVHIWDYGFTSTARDALGNFLMGAGVHLWLWPITLPVYLVCLFLNAYVLRYLYSKRDYLPEVV
jgi:hypothetical protein